MKDTKAHGLIMCKLFEVAKALVKIPAGIPSMPESVMELWGGHPPPVMALPIIQGCFTMVIRWEPMILLVLSSN